MSRFVTRLVLAAWSRTGGDKAVWKLLDRYEDDAVDVAMDGPIPQDVDTWDGYRALRAVKVA